MAFSHSKRNTKLVLVSFLLLTTVVLTGFLVTKLKNESRPQAVDLSDPRCTENNPAYRDTSLPVSERVDDLLGKMTDDEKFGQMMIIEKSSIHDVEEISRYNLGALLSGGGSGPKKDTPEAWLQMTNEFQETTKKTCLRIPLLYGIDAVHGHGNVLGATVFPHKLGLAATRSPDLVRRIAEATAQELEATGIYWTFSPNLDVAGDIRWGKAFETFGSDTATVAELGSAFIQGTQNSSKGYFNVVATAKHYIGGGAMEYGTSRNKDFKIEEGNITLDEKTLRQTHLVPFQKAVESGVQVVMVNTATWNGAMNTSNKYLLTDVLKDELNFSGFIVSDWYAVYLVTPNRYDAVVQSINAGIDMVMTPFEYKDFIINMQKAVASGDISKERVDDAIRRILTVKFKAGLFDRPNPTKEGLAVIGSEEHRALAREAVRTSQVLLKNTNTALPISKNVSRIIVAGSAADNLGRQAGGWTTEWQGIDGNYGIVGTTILQAIQESVSQNTDVEYNKEGNFPKNKTLADVGIAVVGEKPYAEGWGDNPNPRLSAEDLATIQKVKERSKKIVVVMVTGRPLNIKDNINLWDGVVASWLPGSEARGVTDTLFGDHPFVGSLPMPWPLR